MNNLSLFTGFRLTDYLLKIIIWRQDLNTFFKDITGLEPRAFQEEFFEEVQGLQSKNIVIVAGRSIGKTLALAAVAFWYVLVLSVTEHKPMKVVILAGSLKQAKICYTYIMDFINASSFFQKQLAKEPTQEEILFKDGSWVRPLPASEKSVRGHHPDLLIIDEAAHVADNIIYASIPMTVGPYARQIFSSTPSGELSWIDDKWEHQGDFKYPFWKFFNWNAESFLPPEKLALLKEMYKGRLEEYCTEIQGFPYKREGKVFPLEDLKKCLFNPADEVKEEEDEEDEELGDIYGGLDWGYYPAPTVVLIVKKINDHWEVLYTEEFLAQNFEEIHAKVKEICLERNVISLFTDSTDKGENLRLAARGVPVVPVSFKGEKAQMLSNLRSLVERHKIRINSASERRLIDEMLSYVYDSKRNDDYVDAFMLAVKANPIPRVSNWDLEAILKEAIIRKEDKKSKGDIKQNTRSILEEIGRKENV